MTTTTMKQTWVRPQALAQVFAPREYVSACYKIYCNTPGGNSYQAIVWDTDGDGDFNPDVNYQSGVGSGTDTSVYWTDESFTGCGKWHKGIMLGDAPTANGWVANFIENPNQENDYILDSETAVPVYIWTENLGSSSEYHVMVAGTAALYETNPNAS